MNKRLLPENQESIERLEAAYRSEKPFLLSRMRKAGQTLEDAEDLIHDVYMEIAEGVELISGINNLPAWIHALFTRRMIDAWRRNKYRSSQGETDIAEDTLREIIMETGLDPLDAFVRDNLVDALNAAITVLPLNQRYVIEAQVFGGKTFREISKLTGEKEDTLKARKRYALKNLARALRHWIDE